jgi:hypothetical protein
MVSPWPTGWGGCCKKKLKEGDHMEEVINGTEIGWKCVWLGVMTLGDKRFRNMHTLNYATRFQGRNSALVYAKTLMQLCAKSDAW